ncbi:MAG TPA: hypothetical protein VFA45_23890 [Actinomycetes bacterium]|nr:hypothetical protein [Actinomycetes bacterium]
MEPRRRRIDVVGATARAARLGDDYAPRSPGFQDRGAGRMRC